MTGSNGKDAQQKPQYLLFGYPEGSPRGGADDFLGCFFSHHDAKQGIKTCHFTSRDGMDALKQRRICAHIATVVGTGLSTVDFFESDGGWASDKCHRLEAAATEWP